MKKKTAVKKLERKWGRRVLALMALTFLCALVPVVMYYGVKVTSPLWLILGGGGAAVCMALGFFLRLRHLRCPYCRRGLAVPQWSPGRRYVCPVCRKPFVYDDEQG